VQIIQLGVPIQNKYAAESFAARTSTFSIIRVRRLFPCLLVFAVTCILRKKEKAF